MSAVWLRMRKWEFWPFWLFYIPIYFYWFWLSIRARSFLFFSAANPAMKLGGFSGYSKYAVLSKFPACLVPKTLLVDTSKQTLQEVLQLLKQENLTFPLIVKPNIGERGWKVEKISNEESLLGYLSANRQQLLLQEYVNYPLEFGIMYHRLPGQATGQITSLVQKEFLAVKGNGTSTLLELFKKHHRARYHLEMLVQLYKGNLNRILPDGEVRELVSIGNHCRGTTFLNANHLITPALVQVFDKISSQIEGFYFGRYDIRVAGLDDLYVGTNIKVLELNGANSEPAHIYDPHMSIIGAYKHLFKHWHTLYIISIQNHKSGVPYTPFWQGITAIFNRKSPGYVSAS